MTSLSVTGSEFIWSGEETMAGHDFREMVVNDDEQEEDADDEETYFPVFLLVSGFFLFFSPFS